MSAIMDQHQRWLEARKRLDNAAKPERAQKSVTLVSVSRGRAEQIVRIGPEVPLPSAATKRERPRAGSRPVEFAHKDQRRAAAIIAFVARRHCVTVAALKSEQRFVEVAHARQEAYYRLLTEVAMSSPEVGRMLGGRDHSTVLSGAKAYAKRRGKSMP